LIVEFLQPIWKHELSEQLIAFHDDLELKHDSNADNLVDLTLIAEHVGLREEPGKKIR